MDKERLEDDIDRFVRYCISLIVGVPVYFGLLNGGTITYTMENCIKRFIRDSIDCNKPYDDVSELMAEYMNELSDKDKDEYFSSFVTGIQKGCHILKDMYTDNKAEVNVDQSNYKVTVILELN